MLDAVNDRAVFLTENDIAVLSHDLYDQLFSFLIQLDYLLLCFALYYVILNHTK